MGSSSAAPAAGPAGSRSRHTAAHSAACPALPSPQMHVHVADLQAGVKAWLQNTPGLGQNPDGKPHAADCVFNSHANILCTPNSAGHTTATCTAGATPSAVQPFKTTYHYPPQPAIAGYTGTLVYSPKAGTFCVVSFDDKPVKCMLYCPISNQCNTNPKVKCP